MRNIRAIRGDEHLHPSLHHFLYLWQFKVA